jgi:hypothetical protein
MSSLVSIEWESVFFSLIKGEWECVAPFLNSSMNRLDVFECCSLGTQWLLLDIYRTTVNCCSILLKSVETFSIHQI